MMSTTPQLPIHDIPSQKFSSPAPMLANSVKAGKLPINDGDDRSSSLSDIEDRTANNELGHTSHTIRGGSDTNDTEAETERLEDSPQKVRRHTNVVLSSSNGVYHKAENAVEEDMLSVNGSPGRSKVPRPPDGRDVAPEMDQIDTRLEQTSEISSLEDSSEDLEKSAPSFIAPSRKRKRKSPRSNSFTEDEKTEVASMKKTQPPLNGGFLPPTMADKEAKVERFLVDNDLNSGSDKRKYAELGVETTSSQNPSPSKSKSKKGKRKTKKTRDDDLEHSNVAVSYADSQAEHFDNMEQVDSNGEDVEMEDIGEGPEADLAARTEEGLVKKKSAMDSLSAIEKCFATLRDKLFDERFTHYNDELAMLNQPVPNHPEFLAQKDVIDRYRNDKVDYEETLFKYKLIALQKNSIAEKAQIHSQYIQTVREIRDRNLEQLNQEWYRIQRERRSCEDNVPDYLYKFTTRRSQQIRQQTAYNTEVSILSGVAKYVGFPAAPDINGARSSEIDDDFAEIAVAMGQTNTQTSHATHKQSAIMKSNSASTTAHLSRLKPAAEERFLEQNPWANPQHPAHHQQHHAMQRQISNLSRPASPVSTPIGQRRITDLTVPQGSASTIAEPQSGPNSSIAPTPATHEEATRTGRLHQTFPADSSTYATPSRMIETPIATPLPDSMASELVNEEIKAQQSGMLEHPDAPSSFNNPAQSTSEILHDAPKQLPAKEGISLSSSSNVTMSPRTHYPVIKAEDPTQTSHSSPTLNHYENPDISRLGMNGHPERFGVL